MTETMLIDYAERRLSADDLLSTDDHLAECSQCRTLAAGVLPLSSSERALRRFFCVDHEHHHLSFAELSQYVEGTLDDAAAQAADEHFEDCDHCHTELTVLREQYVPAGSRVSYDHGAVAEPVSFVDQVKAFFSAGALRFAIPAVLFGAITLAAFWLTGPPLGSQPEIGSAVPPVETAPSTAVLPEPNEPPAANEEVLPPAERAAITVEDGRGRIEIGADGKLVTSFAPAYDKRVAEALNSGTLAIAPEAARVRGSAGTLMGTQGTASTLRVQTPVGKVVASRQPEFRWSPVTGASSYTVEIFDQNFNKVASSPQLSVTTWRPSPLAAGREYSWQVTAVKADETIKAPVRPAPEAKFYVVSDAAMRDIENARRIQPNSHLVLGITYANAGLLDEAEREFTAVLKRNPNSAQVKRLLGRVRAAK